MVEVPENPAAFTTNELNAIANTRIIDDELNYHWMQVSGRGSATISAAEEPSTTAMLRRPGK